MAVNDCAVNRCDLAQSNSQRARHAPLPKLIN
jgi:hypothetical protein